MKVLVIYAHPNRESFNHAILDRFTRGLVDGGHDHEVVDLYEIGFDPCFRLEDYNQYVGGKMPSDVVEQQEKVSWANALVFIAPVWWMHFPAILKGWVERVFSHDFAYRMTDDGWSGEVKGRIGLLRHEKALIISTTFFSEHNYRNTGMQEAMGKIVDEYGFQYPGIQNVQHVYFYGAVSVDDETRKGYLDTAYRLGREF